MSDFNERNRRFSKGLTDMQMAYIETERIVSDLQSENITLRKLVWDMWEFGFSKNAGANSIEEWKTKHDRLYDRLCELGVEVDE